MMDGSNARVLRGMTEHCIRVSLEEKRSVLDKMVAFVGKGAPVKGFGVRLGDPLGDQLPTESTGRQSSLPN